MNAEFDARIHRFALQVAIAATLISALPTLLGWMVTPPGQQFLGHPYNLDDHMVYSAWMRQAMDGALFFDNRFAIDDQPRLTFHLYFLLLGWVAKGVGLVAASTLARMAFTFLFVFLLARLCSRLTQDVFVAKLMITLTMLGGGIGFLMWRPFGVDLPDGSPFQSALQGGLPIDVWQPEAFVFPSLLTNGLFMVSLCLMVGIMLAVLGSRDDRRAILPGLLMMLVLMNIHSYDVALIGMVLVAFLVAQVAARAIDWAWLGRATLIVSGALPAAAWFWYVLRNDPVFQARAATETYTRGFRATVAGLLPMALLAFPGWASTVTGRIGWKRILPATGLLLGLTVLAEPAANRYWMGLSVWIAVFVLAIAAAAALASANPALNLVTSWATVSLVAPYFPGLFQRKLAMGIAIPWCLLAAFGIAWCLRHLDRGARNLATALAILIVSASSMLWLQRLLKLERDNVSNTTVHALYLPRDMVQVVRYLDAGSGRRVVFAPPGIPAPLDDGSGFASPAIPDWNPVLSGLTGVYSYAGHWSETPQYAQRRSRLWRDFYNPAAPDAQRRQMLRDIRPTYVLGMKPDVSQGMLTDVRNLGEVVVEGATYVLVKIAY